MPGDTFASGTGDKPQEIMTNPTRGNSVGLNWTGQVGNDQAGHEAPYTSLLSLTSSISSRPIMSTGGGILSPNICSQFTPSPVPTDTTTSTVTLTTSSASVSAQKWEQHYKLWVPAPQGGRIDLSDTGPATIHHASMPGPQLDFSPPVDSLLTSTTSLPGGSYQDPAMISRPTSTPVRQEGVLPVPIPEGEETFAPAVEQGASGDAATHLAHEEPCTSSTMSVIDTAHSTNGMAEGLLCPTTGCGYTTTTHVPDDTDLAAKIQLLQVHIAAVHNGGGGQVRTPGSSDGTIAAAYKDPRNSCTSRSKNSRKRNKSRKFDVHCSGMVTMLF